ncbi:uncharacterized protein MONOS_3910 [Monocercomonoides exilis]|uniref:uncharacterized protein n=1 Tax=Monocercomonoides exilis TaxID=2049356 RepID=UPI003559A810|nr:hypothetical protein MONOS_3910 [Monocercomonoides exilis]|eukprot:MONOS_3910.1-p1 / transcript=MONOS_3910.1 / gene=MONOS_3910 / organism=Monocercomonoides_exilis_PA203 / gene_product=unspecified product / transcript_product=unspecified product / location=Mono_scaffold00097:9432-16701(+) / protein_length=2405 / sequence_SO=supercontig / SO=protein_coding / is_pseudo=false
MYYPQTQKHFLYVRILQNIFGGPITVLDTQISAKHYIFQIISFIFPPLLSLLIAILCHLNFISIFLGSIISGGISFLLHIFHKITIACIRTHSAQGSAKQEGISSFYQSNKLPLFSFKYFSQIIQQIPPAFSHSCGLKTIAYIVSAIFSFAMGFSFIFIHHAITLYLKEPKTATVGSIFYQIFSWISYAICVYSLMFKSPDELSQIFVIDYFIGWLRPIVYLILATFIITDFGRADGFQLLMKEEDDWIATISSNFQKLPYHLSSAPMGICLLLPIFFALGVIPSLGAFLLYCANQFTRFCFGSSASSRTGTLLLTSIVFTLTSVGGGVMIWQAIINLSAILFAGATISLLVAACIFDYNWVDCFTWRPKKQQKRAKETKTQQFSSKQIVPMNTSSDWNASDEQTSSSVVRLSNNSPLQAKRFTPSPSAASDKPNKTQTSQNLLRIKAKNDVCVLSSSRTDSLPTIRESSLRRKRTLLLSVISDIVLCAFWIAIALVNAIFDDSDEGADSSYTSFLAPSFVNGEIFSIARIAIDALIFCFLVLCWWCELHNEPLWFGLFRFVRIDGKKVGGAEGEGNDINTSQRPSPSSSAFRTFAVIRRFINTFFLPLYYLVISYHELFCLATSMTSSTLPSPPSLFLSILSSGLLLHAIRFPLQHPDSTAPLRNHSLAALIWHVTTNILIHPEEGEFSLPGSFLTTFLFLFFLVHVSFSRLFNLIQHTSFYLYSVITAVKIPKVAPPPFNTQQRSSHVKMSLYLQIAVCAPVSFVSIIVSSLLDTNVEQVFGYPFLVLPGMMIPRMMNLMGEEKLSQARRNLKEKEKEKDKTRNQMKKGNSEGQDENEEDDNEYDTRYGDECSKSDMDEAKMDSAFLAIALSSSKIGAKPNPSSSSSSSSSSSTPQYSLSDLNSQSIMNHEKSIYAANADEVITGLLDMLFGAQNPLKDRTLISGRLNESSNSCVADYSKQSKSSSKSFSLSTVFTSSLPSLFTHEKIEPDVNLSTPSLLSSIEPNTQLMLRCGCMTLIVTIGSVSRTSVEVNVKGLEMQETSCHHLEIGEVDKAMEVCRVKEWRKEAEKTKWEEEEEKKRKKKELEIEENVRRAMAAVDAGAKKRKEKKRKTSKNVEEGKAKDDDDDDDDEDEEEFETVVTLIQPHPDSQAHNQSTNNLSSTGSSAISTLSNTSNSSSQSKQASSSFFSILTNPRPFLVLHPLASFSTFCFEPSTFKLMGVLSHPDALNEMRRVLLYALMWEWLQASPLKVKNAAVLGRSCMRKQQKKRHGEKEEEDESVTKTNELNESSEKMNDYQNGKDANKKGNKILNVDVSQSANTSLSSLYSSSSSSTDSESNSSSFRLVLLTDETISQLSPVYFTKQHYKFALRCAEYLADIRQHCSFQSSSKNVSLTSSSSSSSSSSLNGEEPRRLHLFNTFSSLPSFSSDENYTQLVAEDEELYLSSLYSGEAYDSFLNGKDLPGLAALNEKRLKILHKLDDRAAKEAHKAETTPVSLLRKGIELSSDLPPLVRDGMKPLNPLRSSVSLSFSSSHPSSSSSSASSSSSSSSSSSISPSSRTSSPFSSFHSSSHTFSPITPPQSPSLTPTLDSSPLLTSPSLSPFQSYQFPSSSSSSSVAAHSLSPLSPTEPAFSAEQPSRRRRGSSTPSPSASYDFPSKSAYSSYSSSSDDTEQPPQLSSSPHLPSAGVNADSALEQPESPVISTTPNQFSIRPAHPQASQQLSVASAASASYSLTEADRNSEANENEELLAPDASDLISPSQFHLLRRLILSSFVLLDTNSAADTLIDLKYERVCLSCYHIKESCFGTKCVCGKMQREEMDEKKKANKGREGEDVEDDSDDDEDDDEVPDGRVHFSEKYTSGNIIPKPSISPFLSPFAPLGNQSTSAVGSNKPFPFSSSSSSSSTNSSQSTKSVTLSLSSMPQIVEVYNGYLPNNALALSVRRLLNGENWEKPKTKAKATGSSLSSYSEYSFGSGYRSSYYSFSMQKETQQSNQSSSSSSSSSSDKPSETETLSSEKFIKPFHQKLFLQVAFSAFRKAATIAHDHYLYQEFTPTTEEADAEDEKTRKKANKKEDKESIFANNRFGNKRFGNDSDDDDDDEDEDDEDDNRGSWGMPNSKWNSNAPNGTTTGKIGSEERETDSLQNSQKQTEKKQTDISKENKEESTPSKKLKLGLHGEPLTDWKSALIKEISTFVSFHPSNFSSAPKMPLFASSLFPSIVGWNNELSSSLVPPSSTSFPQSSSNRSVFDLSDPISIRAAVVVGSKQWIEAMALKCDQVFGLTKRSAESESILSYDSSLSSPSSSASSSSDPDKDFSSSASSSSHIGVLCTRRMRRWSCCKVSYAAPFEPQSTSLVKEFLFAANNDDERFSIQTHPVMLRNIGGQSLSEPFGYLAFESGRVFINF